MLTPKTLAYLPILEMIGNWYVIEIFPLLRHIIAKYLLNIFIPSLIHQYFCLNAAIAGHQSRRLRFPILEMIGNWYVIEILPLLRHIIAKYLINIFIPSLIHQYFCLNAATSGLQEHGG